MVRMYENHIIAQIHDLDVLIAKIPLPDLAVTNTTELLYRDGLRHNFASFIALGWYPPK